MTKFKVTFKDGTVKELECPSNTISLHIAYGNLGFDLNDVNSIERL
jgi:hypothetical protein